MTWSVQHLAEPTRAGGTAIQNWSPKKAQPQLVVPKNPRLAEWDGVNGLVTPQEINIRLTGTVEGIGDTNEHGGRGKGGEKFSGDHVCV
jgi:hypothetical protein